MLWLAKSSIVPRGNLLPGSSKETCFVPQCGIHTIFSLTVENMKKKYVVIQAYAHYVISTSEKIYNEITSMLGYVNRGAFSVSPMKWLNYLFVI